jgi:hypothetical protein
MAWYNEQKKEPEYLIPEEAGREAVLELVNFYGIEFGREPDKDFDLVMDQLAAYYRRGLLENKPDEKLGFCVVQHLENGKDITYREMKGEDRLVHGKYDAKTETDQKVNAVLGKLSGLGPDAVMKLMKDDRRAAVILASLFFGV